MKSTERHSRRFSSFVLQRAEGLTCVIVSHVSFSSDHCLVILWLQQIKIWLLWSQNSCSEIRRKQFTWPSMFAQYSLWLLHQTKLKWLRFHQQTLSCICNFMHKFLQIHTSLQNPLLYGCLMQLIATVSLACSFCCRCLRLKINRAAVCVNKTVQLRL